MLPLLAGEAGRAAHFGETVEYARRVRVRVVEASEAG
jgi:hypothetical protein